MQYDKYTDSSAGTARSGRKYRGNAPPTVALHPDELGRLREALALNAVDTDDDEDDLEPLR